MNIKIIFCSIIFIILGCKKPLDPKSNQNSDLPQTSTKLEIEWDKSFGGSEDDNAKCMTKTLEGDLIIGGNSRSSKGSGNKDSFYLGYENFWVIKIDKNGNKITEAKVTQLSNRQFEVELLVDVRKYRREKSNTLEIKVTDDFVEIGFYSTITDKLPIEVKRIRVDESKKLKKFTIGFKPGKITIDPYLLMIDKNSKDNSIQF